MHRANFDDFLLLQPTIYHEPDQDRITNDAYDMSINITIAKNPAVLPFLLGRNRPKVSESCSAIKKNQVKNAQVDFRQLSAITAKQLYNAQIGPRYTIMFKNSIQQIHANQNANARYIRQLRLVPKSAKVAAPLKKTSKKNHARSYPPPLARHTATCTHSPTSTEKRT